MANIRKLALNYYINELVKYGKTPEEILELIWNLPENLYAVHVKVTSDGKLSEIELVETYPAEKE